MKITHYAGCDPGFSGAFGVLSADGGTAEVHPMPTIKRNGQNEMDLVGLKIIMDRLRRFPNLCLGIEWPVAFPGSFANVTRDAENFGRGKGYLEGFAFLLGIKYVRVSPLAWKKKLGLPGKTHDKNSTQGALLWDNRFPAHSGLIRGVRGGLKDGPLDAFLIAEYLRVAGESPCGHKGGRRPPTIRGLGNDGQLAQWWNRHTQEHK